MPTAGSAGSKQASRATPKSLALAAIGADWAVGALAPSRMHALSKTDNVGLGLVADALLLLILLTLGWATVA